MRKISVYFLIFALVFSMLPFGVFAAGDTETTTSTDTTASAQVVSEQLILGDELTMRFVIEAESDTVVNVTVDSKTVSYDLSTMTPDENGQYDVVAKLAAAQMTESIVLDFIQNDTNILQKTYSIREYAVSILEGDYSTETKNLVKWMLGYGAKAQLYFNEDVNNLANAGYEITESAVLPTEYKEKSVSGSISGLYFYGASLVFENQVAVRYYFTGSTENVSFGDYKAVAKNGMYYVEVPGINPHQYADSITLTATKGEENLSVSYSPLNYIIRMSSRDTTSDALKALLSAMYGYHEAAVAFAAVNDNAITFNTLSDMMLSAGEETGTVELTATAANASAVSFSAKSGDESIARVSTKGNVLTVIPLAMGKATITVTASAKGCAAAQQSFTVTVMKDALHYKADGTAYEDGVTVEAWEDASAGWDHAGSTYKTYIGSPEGAYKGDFTIHMDYNTKEYQSTSAARTARIYIHDYSDPNAYWIFSVPWSSHEVKNNSTLGDPTKEVTTTIPSADAAKGILKNCDVDLTICREGTVLTWNAIATAGEGTGYEGQTFTTTCTLTGITSDILQVAISNRAFAEYTINDIKICGTLYDPNTREGAWQETDGKVVIPASAAEELSTHASYSSVNEYDTWAKYTDGQLDGIIQNSTTGATWSNMNMAFYNAPQVHYTFHVTNPGRYYLYLLTSYPDLSGNSVYAFLDTDRALIKCATEDYGEGVWLSDASWYFDIDETGEHTITICAREDGVILNQIMLSQNSAETVTNGVEQTVSTRNPYTVNGLLKEVNGDVTIDLSTALDNSEYAYNTIGHAGDTTVPYRWERSTGYDGVQVYPDTGVVWGTNSVSPKLSYQVDFTTPGEYYVMLYSSFKDYNSDSVYISVDDGAIMSCESQIAKGPEKWNGNAAWKITIPEAGVHTINVYPREDGAILHELRLTQNPESVETLVIGDSYTGKHSWIHLDEQLASIGGQSIGISGTVVSLWMNNVEELKFYNPKNLVVHIGINDLNSGTSGTDCGNSVVALLEELQTALPDTKIFYVSVCNTTGYTDEWEDYAVSNQIVQEYIQGAGESNLYFIDFASVMNVEGPSMTNSGFRDGLHLNDEGYVLFSQMICDAVKEANLGTTTQLTINDISNRTMGMEAETIELLASASNNAVVSFSAASGNTDVVSVSISDNVLTVTPLSKGEAQITVTASALGCKSVSETFTIVVSDSVDLVLFIGQSYMVGNGDASKATKVKEGHAYEFRAISDPTKLYPLEEPFGKNENNAASGIVDERRTGSMMSAFCEAYYAETGTPIVAVSCSKSGASVSFFDVGTAAYEDAVSRINSAKAFLQTQYDGGNTQFKLGNVYVVWMQGETDGDRGTTAEAYNETLDRIVQGFKSDIGAAQTFVIPIGTTEENNGSLRAKYNTIRDAQIQYCLDNRDATVISLQTVDIQRYGYSINGVYSDQAGYEIVGRDAGTNMAYFAMTGNKPDCQRFYNNEPDVRENGAWLEEDGKVVIPAVAALELSTYANYSSAPGYGWEKYTNELSEGIRQNTDDTKEWGSGASAFTGAPQLHYTFQINTPGRYYLYMLASHPGAGSNSVYASIDGGDIITCTNNTYGKNKWLSGATWYFDIAEAGEHTIALYTRESGIVLQQIVLSQNSAEAVTNGVLQAVSARGTYAIHDIYKEVNGEVTIELSSALENSKYVYSTVGSASDMEETFQWERSTGSDGIQVYPDCEVLWGTNNISPKVSYQVEFTQPGEYYVMMLTSFPDVGADSVYVSVNNGAIMNCSHPFAMGPEKWLADPAWKITIPYAGVHTINVYPREDGAVLHKLLITKNPEPVQTLVFGDSYTSQTYWKTFDEQLASIGGQTIGVSGSEVDVWLKNAETLKIYAPKNLVIHIGVNDINRGQSGTDCGNEVVALLEKLQTIFPESNIFYISICDNTSNEKWWTEYAASNEIVKGFIDSAQNLHYIDYAAAMKTEADNMTNSGFSDGLHPNSDGYALLSQMICDAVTEANQD